MFTREKPLLTANQGRRAAGFVVSKAPSASFRADTGQRHVASSGLGCKARGYTLLELVFVMTLMVALLAALSSGLGQNGGRTEGVQVAQTRLAALLREAGLQARSHQVAARLLVDADPNAPAAADNYLRKIQIVYGSPATPGEWTASAAPDRLPRGTAIVPPVLLPRDLAAGVVWPGGGTMRVSTLAGPANHVVDGQAFGSAYYLEFFADGISASSVSQIVVGTTRSTRGTAAGFDHPDSVRAVRITSAGAISLIDDPNDL